MLQGSEPCFLDVNRIEGLRECLEDPVYLGDYEQTPYFVCRLRRLPESLDEGDFINLRQACRSMNEFHRELLFYAQSLLNWLKNHAFCSRCGSETGIINAGHGRQCSNSACGRILYPKIDPAVIFSIINNSGPESTILLGRQKAWEEHRYSVVAGFVEAGETLEDAVRREALEETGLKLGKVSYVASQPWPFPDSLMLGFTAECSQQVITLVDQELEAANWFSASDLEGGVKNGHIKLPFHISISWHLINRWFRSETGYSLEGIDPQLRDRSF
jgi:NAD+ diphosphatase